MKFVHIAGDGGLVPTPFVRDSFKIMPAKRKEMIVDFSRYQDGTPTQSGDAIYLTNSLLMTEGRQPDQLLPGQVPPIVPMMKFVIDGNGTPPDFSLIPRKLRPLPPRPSPSVLAGLPRRRWVLERPPGDPVGTSEWLINGQPFDHHISYADIPQGTAEVWEIVNGGGGWVHPLHIHQEEHQTLSRNGQRLRRKTSARKTWWRWRRARRCRSTASSARSAAGMSPTATTWPTKTMP